MNGILYLGIVLAVAVPFGCAGYVDDSMSPSAEEPLNVHCEQRMVPVGVDLTFQDVCGETSFISITESMLDDAMFPLNVVASIIDSGVTYSIQKTGITRNDLINSNGGVDLTDTLQITETACNGRTGKKQVEVIGADEEVLRKSSAVRLVCNYADIDIALRSVPDPIPTADLTVSNPTIQDVMASFSLTVTVTGAITGSLPPLTDGAGYFLYAYINQTTEMDPKPAFKNRVIGTPRMFADSGSLQTALQELFDEVTSMATLPAGHGEIVIMADGLYTAYNEPNRDNNVLRIPYYSDILSADSDMKCLMINNAWNTEMGGFVYPGMDGWNNALYTYNMESGWSKSYKSVESHGYHRLALLEKYLMMDGNSFMDSCLALGDASSLTDFLNFLDGSEDTTPIGDDIARQALEASDSSAIQIIRTSLLDTTSVTGMVRSSILEAAEEYLDSMVQDDYHGEVCSLQSEFDGIRYHLNQRTIGDVKAEGGTDTYLAQLAAKVTKAGLYLKDRYPVFTGLNKLLNALLSIAEKMDAVGIDAEKFDLSGFYDNSDIDEEMGAKESTEDLVYCARRPSYMKKLAALCSVQDLTVAEDIMIYKDDICRAAAFRNMASVFWQTIGMKDLWEELLNQQMIDHGVECARDPLKPESGPTIVWKISDATDGTSGQQIEIGTLSPDNTKIYFTTKAVCLCPQCSGDDGLSGYDDATGTDYPMGSDYGTPLK